MGDLIPYSLRATQLRAVAFPLYEITLASKVPQRSHGGHRPRHLTSVLFAGCRHRLVAAIAGGHAAGIRLDPGSFSPRRTRRQTAADVCHLQ